MKLDAIHIHPIKSCGGCSVLRATLDDRGLVHDRRYMLVDEHDRFVSLRTEPSLARVGVALRDDGFEVDLGGAGALRLPFELDEGPRRPVRVWDDEVDAIELPSGTEAFSSWLGARTRLVHMPRSTVRGVDPRFARATDRVGFADAYPLLLLGRASVDDLGVRVGRPMAMARFRPNLVFVGGAPYDEDRFAELAIGSVRFRGPKACSRCVATTVEPDTGHTGTEPMKTLAGFRRANGKVWLGMNLLHDAPGELAVGDPLVVHRWHDQPAFGG